MNSELLSVLPVVRHSVLLPSHVTQNYTSLSNSAQWGSQIFFLSKSHFDHSFYKNYLCMKNGEPEIWFFQPDYVNLVFVTSRQHHLGFVIKKSLAFRCNGYKLLQKNKIPTINRVDQSENPFNLFLLKESQMRIFHWRFIIRDISGTIFANLFNFKWIWELFM